MRERTVLSMANVLPFLYVALKDYLAGTENAREAAKKCVALGDTVNIVQVTLYRFYFVVIMSSTIAFVCRLTLSGSEL